MYMVSLLFLLQRVNFVKPGCCGYSEKDNTINQYPPAELKMANETASISNDESYKGW